MGSKYHSTRGFAIQAFKAQVCEQQAAENAEKEKKRLAEANARYLERLKKIAERLAKPKL
jgi:hypothetical protein